MSTDGMGMVSYSGLVDLSVVNLVLPGSNLSHSATHSY